MEDECRGESRGLSNRTRTVRVESWRAMEALEEEEVVKN